MRTLCVCNGDMLRSRLMSFYAVRRGRVPGIYHTWCVDYTKSAQGIMAVVAVDAGLNAALK